MAACCDLHNDTCSDWEEACCWACPTWLKTECSVCEGRGYIGDPVAAQFGKAPKCPICDGSGRAA